MTSIYNGLMRRTIASIREYVPDLAASMPLVSSDYKNWTFTLKSGLKFSDGSDLNASSVVFSYKVHLTKSIDAGYNALFSYPADKPYFTNNSIYEIDNLKVQFNMSQPYAFAPSLFSLWIYSEDHFGPQYDACLDDVTLAACDWNTDLNGRNLQGGSGPFMMDKYDTANNFIELVPNLNYYNAAQIKIDRIVIKYIKDATEAKAAFATGEINVFDSQYETEAQSFVNLAGVTDIFVGTPKIQELVINHNLQYFGLGNYSTPTRDANGAEAYTLGANQTAARNIRKAMSHMIDRVFIADKIAGGLGTPIATIMPKISIGWDETILPHVYNQDIAKNYMEKAGFDYTGKTFDASTGAMNEPFFSITIQEQSADREKLISLIVNELPKIGIGVKFIELTYGVYELYPRTYTHPRPPPSYEECGYDIIFVGWRFGLDFNPVGLYESEFQQPECCNVYNYNNITTETAIADYIAELDAAARLPLVKRVQELLYDDLPSIPIFNTVDHWVWSNQIIGLDGLSMSQRLFEWELVDIDFAISGVTSIPIPTEIVTTTETANPSNNDPTRTNLEQTTSIRAVSFIGLNLLLSSFYVIILIRKRMKNLY